MQNDHYDDKDDYRYKTTQVCGCNKMASKVIAAVKYTSMPNSREVQEAKAKNIEWQMRVTPERVAVVRRNNSLFDQNGQLRAPTERVYMYETPSPGSFERLVSTVQRERDALLQQQYHY